MNHSDNVTRKERIKTKISLWQKSGKSVNKFCKEEQISVYTFRYWLKKWGIKSRQNSGDGYEGTFVPLIKKPDNKLPEQSSEKIEIFYPNGIEIRLPGKTEPEFIKALISIV